MKLFHYTYPCYLRSIEREGLKPHSLCGWGNGTDESIKLRRHLVWLTTETEQKFREMFPFRPMLRITVVLSKSDRLIHWVDVMKQQFSPKHMAKCRRSSQWPSVNAIWIYYGTIRPSYLVDIEVEIPKGQRGDLVWVPTTWADARKDAGESMATQIRRAKRSGFGISADLERKLIKRGLVPEEWRPATPQIR